MEFYLQYVGLSLGLLMVLLLEKSFAQTYKAAVIAYQPERLPNELPNQVRVKNKQRYIQFMEKVRDRADIIIFPEYGLTTNEPSTKPRAHLASDGIIVPDLQSIPCHNSQGDILVGLSCGAQTSRIYVVCNVVEKSGEGKEIKFYSTNVVFDPEGRLISKCRKKYPANSTKFDKGDPNQKCIFDAKFKNTQNSVKFALLFDSDIAYESLEDISHVILTSSMKNELPIAYGLNLQVGYSVSNKVNLLASGYTDINKTYGGSGIYLKNGTSKVVLYPDTIISEIPIDEKVTGVTNVDVPSPSKLPDSTFYDNIVYKTISTLNNLNTTVRYSFSEDNYCKFETNLNGDIKPYEWVASSGSIQYLGQDIPHLIFCGLIKPQGQKDERKISKLTVTTTFTSNNVIQLLPISLRSNMLPANFQFEEKYEGSLRTSTMSLTKEEDLLSFGIVVILKDTVPSSGPSIKAFHICTIGFLSMFLALWSKELIFSL